MDLNMLLRDFGTVTLSLSTLIAVQLIICGVGMFIAGLSFLCVYEPKINGPLQHIIPVVPIKTLKKKLVAKKKKNNQLLDRQKRDINKQENKHLMSATDTDYMTVQQHDESSQTESDSNSASGDEDDDDDDDDVAEDCRN